MKESFNIESVLCSCLLMFGYVGLTQADTFHDRVHRLLDNHHLNKMVAADVATAEVDIDKEKSAYYPKISIKGMFGQQDIVRDTGTSGNYDPSEVSVTINQTVYDFGVISSRVATAEKITEKERAEQSLQQANLVLAAIEAQLGIIKANKVLGYAKSSEESIKTQTLMENARLKLGRGYATDVLQAKAQLAGAEASLIQAESQMQQAQYRYEAVFYEKLEGIEELEMLEVPHDLLPKSLAEAEQLVVETSPDVSAAKLRVDVAKAQRASIRKQEYMPDINLSLSHEDSRERDGVLGRRDDTKLELRFNWDFDFGMKARYSVQAASYAAVSAAEKSNYIIVQATEEARNAWTSWEVSRKRSKHLSNQVEISKQFLELAKHEREMGRRSLIDILNGEVALIRAQSDEAEVKVEEVISAFRLLRAIGRLNVDMFRN